MIDDEVAVLEELAEMTREEKLVRLALYEERQRRLNTRKLMEYVPYKKQGDFHAMGATVRERLLMAANQVGKTLSAAAEVAIHLTGRYPDGWKGKVIKRANHWLAGSESGELTRRGVQRLLLGRDYKTERGTGMIPDEDIVDITPARGVPDLVDTVRVKNAYGGVSTISLKSYDQGRGKWQADTVDGVWFDEEPPEDVYFEGLTRTNTTMGMVITTFTPLKGMSAVVKRFLMDKMPQTGVTTMTIDDAMHYTPEQREAIVASYPAHEKEARANGVPTMGSGLIFPVTDESISIAPFPIPRHWPLIIGLDFGYDHPTAATLLAWDRDADIIYVCAEYRYDKASDSPSLTIIHAAAIKPWGTWIPVSWPHDGLQHDKDSGKVLKDQYKAQGLNMLQDKATHPPQLGEEEGTGGNGVEAGLMDMYERMTTGRWKVFTTCTKWMEEKRMYHRKDGKVVKLMDDVISSSRYAYMMKRKAKTKPLATDSLPVMQKRQVTVKSMGI